MGSHRDRDGQPRRLRELPLPWPAGALRERLRSLAAVQTDIRDRVEDGQAEVAVRLDGLEISLDQIADEVRRTRRDGTAADADLGAPDDSPPEWEYVPEGWDAARLDERREGSGWDGGAVARAYRAKWSSFLRAVDGPGPLGVGHEVLDGQDVGREDLVAQNIVLAFAHALERAASTRAGTAVVLSVLDWGGALGHYHEFARRLRPDLALDYHVKELPAVCAEGRRVSPDVTFHETGSCLEGRYDLVMVSSALQYADDWRELVQRLAGAAAGRLYLARVPVVGMVPTYVLRQRAQAYGYNTDYVGWVLNRDELVGAAGDAGWELERELIVTGPLAVAGAPEAPTHASFLFAPGPSP